MNNSKNDTRDDNREHTEENSEFNGDNKKDQLRNTNNKLWEEFPVHTDDTELGEDNLRDSDDTDDNELNDRIPGAKEMFRANRRTILIATGIFVAIAILFVAAAYFLGKKDSGKDTGGNAVSSTLDSSTKDSSEYDNSTAQNQTEAAEDDVNQDPQDIANNQNKDSGAVQNIGDINNNGTITLGIDVAKYQGKIDWQKVKASGVSFAMVRVGYRTDKTGVIYEDAYASYNLQKAAEAGIKTGAYFFSTAVNEAEAVEEAEWVANYIAGYSITYPVVYNCEGFTSPDSRMYGVSNSARTDNASAFLGIMENAGYTGMLYASISELEGSRYWDTQRLSAAYKIWVAQYPSKPYPATSAPNYTGSYAMWQYTNKGIVDGIDGYVDMNISKLSYDTDAEAKDTNASVGNAENDPEFGITFTTVNEQVTAKEETNLRKSPSADGEVAAVLKNGDIVQRVGVGDNGWSKLTYNGQTVYAKTNLLTTGSADDTAAPGVNATFITVNERVTAKSETNLRSVMSTADSSAIVTTLKKGEYVTRTGIGDNGWSRLEYNGQTVYAISSYLMND